LKRLNQKTTSFTLKTASPIHPFVEKVWRCHSQRTGTFSSVAANSFEMVVTHLGGKRFLTLRGPETQATSLDWPGEGEWVAIRFRAGTFMPRFLPGTLRDHNDVNLLDASAHSFWLNGSALDYPDFDNAETFVKRLVKSGLLARDPVVEDALQRRENVSFAFAFGCLVWVGLGLRDLRVRHLLRKW